MLWILFPLLRVKYISFGLKKVLSRSHTRSEGHSTALQSTESHFIA